MGSFERTRETRREVADASAVGMSAAWRIVLSFLAVLAVAGLVSIGIWYFKVATSDVKGAGDAARQNNSAANRLHAQQKYAELHEGIQATDRNIDTLAEAVKNDPTQVNKTNLIGAQNVCQSSVAEYNAMATNVLTRGWIPAGLPVRVGDDPGTDCKPTPANQTP